MPCTECYDNVWICGTETPKCDDLPPTLDDLVLLDNRCGNRWCYVECVTMTASADYVLLFKAGGPGGNCTAQLVKKDAYDPDAYPSWHNAGERTLGPGIFLLWCKKGGRPDAPNPPFKVAVKSVMKCPDEND
jgi:hypothetical protein